MYLVGSSKIKILYRKRANNYSYTMASADEIRELLKENNAVIKKDITDSKAEIMTELKGDIEKAKTEILNSVNSTLDAHLSKINVLEEKVDHLEEIDRQRTEKELQQEVLNKKYNVLLHKVEENEPTQEALITEIVKLLSEISGQNVEFRDIDVMYRLGRKSENKRRPILIRFTTLIKRNSIIKQWKLFAEKNIEISEDFPEEIRTRRRQLLPLVKDLKAKGLKTSLRVDKLLVNGELWSVAKAEDFLAPNVKNNQEEEEGDHQQSKKRKEDQKDSSPSDVNNRKKLPLKLNINKAALPSIKGFFSPTASASKLELVRVQTPKKE